MNIEIFKLSMEQAEPILKSFFIIAALYFGGAIIMLRSNMSPNAVKKGLTLLKVCISIMLFAFTLLFQYDTSVKEVSFEWPKEITLIQMFLLPIILIDIFTGIIEVVTPEKL
ncbi:hypothetical protein EXW28_18285 [Bacillus mycoides]|uniref:hypothetical protein n=1 Tax=Bacillus mycoides TaxID=1405 RepID=UPI001C018BBE|nr:hypothetical protein [Bacillus mycoides]QWG51687.1 hypothetical protein EXW37_18280 [Bacillus mycoides]QWH35490.1 hypothetical protein EXW28_18285 [Bacillus mycoides]